MSGKGAGLQEEAAGSASRTGRLRVTLRPESLSCGPEGGDAFGFSAPGARVGPRQVPPAQEKAP